MSQNATAILAFPPSPDADPGFISKDAANHAPCATDIAPHSVRVVIQPTASSSVPAISKNNLCTRRLKKKATPLLLEN